MLQDRLICEVSDPPIRKHLLTKGDDLTLKDALKDATTMEAVVKDSKDLGPQQGPHDKSSSGGAGVHNVRHRPFTRLPAKQPQGPGGKCNSGDSQRSCYRCGMSNHTSDKCNFNCNKTGHISKVCRAKSKKDYRKKQPAQPVHDVSTNDDIQDEYSLMA